MKVNRLWILAFLFFLGAPGDSFAHHSFTAEFDGSKTITLQGVISKVDWINPHVYVYVDVKGKDGAVTTWALESLPTGFYHRVGVSKAQLLGNAGETVTMEVFPAKEGKNLGWMQKVTYPDGHFYLLAYNAVNGDAK